MPAVQSLPSNFIPFPEFIMAGFNGMINYRVAEQIKNRARFSEFTAWGVKGKIWWDERNKAWFAEVWHKTNLLAVVTAAIIEDLASTIQKEYGWK
ncbi:MAG: hypothetical protein V4539_01020 [Bacteroidota bacterium]